VYECGLDFDWPDVLRESGFRSDFLFEHHWKNRPLRSLFVTLKKSFRARRLLGESVHTRSNRSSGLSLLLLISIVAVFVCFLGSSLLLGESLSLIFGSRTPIVYPFSVSPRQSPQRHFQNKVWGLSEILMEIGNPVTLWSQQTEEKKLLTVVLVVSPILSTTLMLLSLRQTLGRCKVRAEQIIRVMAYAALPTCVLAPLAVCYRTHPGSYS